jgi:hypothetical protein
MDAAAPRRLDTEFLGHRAMRTRPVRRGSFAIYKMSLLGEAERNSIEPIDGGKPAPLVRTPTARSASA